MASQVIDNLKELKGYIAGVVAFAVAIGAFLVKTLHTNEEVTYLTVAGVAIAMLVIGFLIQRSENRQQTALDKHIAQSNAALEKFDDAMLENQRSNLRTEMNLMMALKPENHDTILKMAHRYFVELKGDWVETDEFGAWADKEKEAGRPVHIPAGLASVVADLQAKER